MTDKDREEAICRQEALLIIQAERDDQGFNVVGLSERIARIRAEAAEKAAREERERCADKAEAWIKAWLTTCSVVVDTGINAWLTTCSVAVDPWMAPDLLRSAILAADSAGEKED